MVLALTMKLLRVLLIPGCDLILLLTRPGVTVWWSVRPSPLSGSHRVAVVSIEVAATSEVPLTPLALLLMSHPGSDVSALS